MDDESDKYTITLDDCSYGGASGSTVTLNNNFTFDTGNVLDTGTDWCYTDDNITVDTSTWDDSFTKSPSSIYTNEVGGAMRKRLEAIENRLNILVPDPKKLEKFEALQKAYEHYKSIERLCELDDEEPELPF